MLEARSLAAKRGFNILFEEVGFTVDAGEAMIVSGPNGTGKTTLLRLLAGLSAPMAGEILWEGRVLKPFDGTLRSNTLFAGHAPALKDELTAIENLRILVALARERCTPEQLHEALETVALGARLNVPARALSAGQRRRIGLARLILVPRALWLLDEPVTALDPAGIALLTDLIKAHLARGGAVIAATHQALGLPQARLFSFEGGGE